MEIKFPQHQLLKRLFSPGYIFDIFAKNLMVPSSEMKKNQKIREFTVRLCFLVISERSYVVMSHQYYSPNKNDTSEHVDEKSP